MFNTEAAARSEAAARRQVDQIRHGAGDHIQFTFDHTYDRDRADESFGIGMLWIGKKCTHVCLFDDLPGIHHRHTLRHFSDHTQIVRDQNDRGLHLSA